MLSGVSPHFRPASSNVAQPYRTICIKLIVDRAAHHLHDAFLLRSDVFCGAIAERCVVLLRYSMVTRHRHVTQQRVGWTNHNAFIPRKSKARRRRLTSYDVCGVRNIVCCASGFLILILLLALQCQLASEAAGEHHGL